MFLKVVRQCAARADEPDGRAERKERLERTSGGRATYYVSGYDDTPGGAPSKSSPQDPYPGQGGQRIFKSVGAEVQEPTLGPSLADRSLDEVKGGPRRMPNCNQEWRLITECFHE
jgi:hypothetical protein